MAVNRRLSFQTKLEAVLGSSFVYYQPPPNIQMKFRCIVYETDNIDVQYADNSPYSIHDRYQVTFIRHGADTNVTRQLLALPHSSFRRQHVTSDLHHDVFVIHH